MKIIIIGASGLVGSEILKLLIENNEITSICALTRTPLKIQNPKLQNIIINFDDAKSYESHVKGDVLISCLGTTKKDAGSIAAQRIVDFDYQLNMAKIAKKNQVQGLLLISALGASINSLFPYSRMKAELENELIKLKFDRLIIIRPSLLQGTRERSRLGEEISGKILSLIPHLPGLESLRPTPGKVVASAALRALSKLTPGTHYLTPEHIWKK